ncbi:sulfate ABC transporter permease subunit CysW [Methylobrevis albus]|uniref:Sulfate ABC transporter permease subunit CysW n=1 Tax=Methylobrevis albus TaxID=2793297 RepID=A0A931MXP6_9HYPH|nr:sulfate ABC transporter permease subunit CysW [Methylobrevis albus]MBH0237457.1 sulfate ABC transporter permease subunit CysW [Methylobrevis albus]
MVDTAPAVAPSLAAVPPSRRVAPTTEPRLVRGVLIAITATFLSVFLLFPLGVVFVEAFRNGTAGFLSALADPQAQSAIRLTLLVAAIAVPCNIVFGVAAAWAVAKFEFRGKTLLVSLIDLPFSVSPVVAGLVYVLLLGSNTLIGGWLQESFGLRVIFAVPGIVLATIFVTFPFVARELIPLMEQQGNGDEEAALSLGASGLQTFWRTTLPNVKWALLYGVLLCNARAMGEFGAVAVLSGKLRGQTVTMPLHIELAYNEYASVSAFSVAALLAGLALVTLVVKTFLEWKYADHIAGTGRH